MSELTPIETKIYNRIHTTLQETCIEFPYGTLDAICTHVSKVVAPMIQDTPPEKTPETFSETLLIEIIERLWKNTISTELARFDLDMTYHKEIVGLTQSHSDQWAHSTAVLKHEETRRKLHINAERMDFIKWVITRFSHENVLKAVHKMMKSDDK